ncbi:MAG: PQQ-binding-like beta-propeller repeat protein [Gemmatimonadaceae bacterium]
MKQIRKFGGAAIFVIALSTTACSYVQFLPFLKSPVDARPKGTSSTTRGPAFASGVGASRTMDAAVDWPAYNNDPTGIRYSNLAQVNVSNVSSLAPACRFVSDEKTPMQSGPVVIGGTMYLTSAINTYAIDAATCKLRWRHSYNYSPKPDYDLKTNRGVAYLDTPDGPRLYRGANDGRVYALDAVSGREVWNVLAGDVKKGETFPAAPVAWHGLVYVGNAGGDNFAVTGRMMAFDARTGARVWSFDLVPRSGPASLTWPAETDSVPRGGGTTWTSYTLDTLAGAIYIPTGNAAPDFLQEVREGDDLYTYSVIALDMKDGALLHNYQLLKRDFHDWDIAAAPLLVTTRMGRQIVSEAGKDGHLYGVDRMSGQVVYSTPITTLLNATTPLTESGTRFCPGVQGGVEWNGPAYSASSNMLYVGSVDWCSTVRLDPPSKLKNKLGIPWTGSAKLIDPFGVMDSLSKRRGWLTAVDADDGSVKWRYASQSPIVAGVTATAGGLVFAANLSGDVMAFDQRDGAIRFRYNTGQPIGGGIVSYSVSGKQYIAIASGLDAPLTWQTKSSPASVVVLTLR